MRRILGWLGMGSALGLAALAAGAPAAHADVATRGQVGDLGIAEIACDCTYDGRNDRWVFRSEPRVLALSRGEGELRRGDRILAIDGVPITSDEGGARFARIEPGAPLTLEVERGGRTRSVSMTAGAVAPERALSSHAPRGFGPGVASEMPAESPPSPPAAEPPPVAPETRRAQPAPEAPPAADPPGIEPRRELPAPPAPEPGPTPREILPEGWFGFAIECFPCDGERVADVPHPVWSFGNPPRVYNVTPGSPAARAGLVKGDELTHVDGVSLTSREGGLRFGAFEPGETAVWKVRRGARTLTMKMTAEKRPMELPAPTAPPPAPRAPQALRYAGRLGDNEIEVRGSASVIITEDQEKGELVIKSDGVTVRVRKRGS